MDVRVEAEGFEQASRALRSLPDKVRRSVLRSAVRVGAKEIADAARAEAPVRKPSTRGSTLKALSRRGPKHFAPGFLKREIKARARRRGKRPDRVSYIAGRGRAWYAHLVESGKGGRSGRSRPNRFFARAASRSRSPAIQAFARHFVKRFDAAVKKARRRG